MADKVVSGIGRELRYFEYKLRKRNQTKKNKKDKNSNLEQQDLAWADSGSGEDFHKAVPGSTGEEELQIQVALAMSREEEQERDRQSESDKLRLEMAIKESMQQAENMKKVEQTKNQPSLLDLSLSAPKPAASAPANVFNRPASGSDPWPTNGPTSSTTFDPFANQQQAAAEPEINSSRSDNFIAPNPWGISAPVPQQIVAPVTQDPWGAAPRQDPISTPVNDPWGATPQSSADSTHSPNDAWASAPSPAASQQVPPQSGAWGSSDMHQSVLATSKNVGWGGPSSTKTSVSQNSTWGNPDLFLSSQPQQAPATTYDPFSGVAAATPQAKVDGFGIANAPINPNLSQSNNPFEASGSDVFSAPPFDPLKDFDNLHIQTNEPEPVVLTHDLISGASVAKDLFPVKQPLQPSTVTSGVPAPPISTKTNPQNSFLGENSSLVNLDSGWKYQVPYSTKPLGSTTQNPFQQTGPSKTLNEMMVKPTGFQ